MRYDSAKHHVRAPSRLPVAIIGGKMPGTGICNQQPGVGMQESDLTRVIAKPILSLCLGSSGGSILPGVCGPASGQDAQAGRPAVMLMVPAKCRPPPVHLTPGGFTITSLPCGAVRKTRPHLSGCLTRNKHWWCSRVQGVEGV